MGMISLERFRQKNNQSRDRQRFLNIIYFVDANRTRSFKVPLKTAYWVGGFALSIVIWSSLGTGLLMREVWLSSENMKKSRYLLEAIFQYQARYDDVYEKAYPKDTGEHLAQEKGKPNSSKDPGVKSLSAKTLLPGTQGEAAPIETNASADSPIALENVKSRLRNNELQVSFDIRNNTKPSLAAGTLWGVAKFIADADQSVTYVTSPGNVPLNANGEAPGYRGGYNFSIRYFKARTISFLTPPGVKGSFVDVRIFLANDQGFQTNISFPINGRANKIEDMNPKIEQKIISKQIDSPSNQNRSNTAPAEDANASDPGIKRPKNSLTKPAETTNTSGKQSEPVKVSPASAPIAPASLPQVNQEMLDSMDEDHPVDDEQVEENGN